MTRALLFLVLAALATCIVGVPVYIITDDGSAAKHRAAPRDLGDDDDAAAHAKKGTSFGWLTMLARASADDEAADRVDGRSDLGRLDRVLDAGVQQCAPEIFGYDRNLLERMQGDWHVLKPNLRPSWDAWLGMDGVVVDQEKMASCQAAFAGDDCNKMRDAWEDCTVPFRGTLGEGDACATNEQCASSRCASSQCAAPDDCTAMSSCPAGMLCAADETGFHTCIDQPSEGDPCVTADSDEKLPGVDPTCGGDRVCNEQNACVTARSLGARCGPMAPCKYDLYCDYGNDDDTGLVAVNDDDEEVGRCVVDTGEGDAVVDSEDVDGADDEDPGCACEPYRDGMACIEDKARDRMKCVPVSIVDDGQACDDTHLCRGSLGLSACIQGKCAAALTVGDACDDHDQCKDDLVCIAGACTPPLHDGQECMDGDDCVFGLDCVDRDGKSVCGVQLETSDPYVDEGFAGDRDVEALPDIIIDGIPPELNLAEGGDAPVEDDAVEDVPPDTLEQLNDRFGMNRKIPLDDIE